MAAIIRVYPARTYSLIGIVFMFLVGAVLLISALVLGIPGPGLVQQVILVLGIFVVFLGLAAFMTTAERMRAETVTEGLAAKRPCLVFAVVVLVFGAAFAAVFIGPLANLSLPVALVAFAAAVFFILAHASIQVERIPGPIPPIAGPEIGPTPIEEPPVGPIPATTAAALECKQGFDAGRSFQVMSYDVTIGRSDPTRWRPKPGDIVLSDKTVSRPHARLFFQNGTWNIQDLNSMNGTYVDGTVVPPNQNFALQDGSQVTLGSRTILTFRAAGGEETEVSAKRRR
jgi:hypothetical protein